MSSMTASEDSPSVPSNVVATEPIENDALVNNSESNQRVPATTTENPSTEPSATRPTRTQSGSSIREIYKNGWLKLIPSVSKWSGKIYKSQKPEKFWFVFCVHDEKEAFLELYENRRSAYSHNTSTVIALSQCLHISPTIVVQDNDYEFVITLESQVVRLAAATREHMVEWMDTLQNKLRDLKVLQPKDNVYSREPVFGSKIGHSELLIDTRNDRDRPNEESDAINYESSLSLSGSYLSLRDPNSPLPPVPLSTRLASNLPSTTNLISERTILPSQHNSQSFSVGEQPDVTWTLDVLMPEEILSNASLMLNFASQRRRVSESDLLENNVIPMQQSSSSVPLTPNLNSSDSSLYEPLFSQDLLNTTKQMRNMAILNPSYESAPEPLASSASTPCLPPRNPSRQRSSSTTSEGANSPEIRQNQDFLLSLETAFNRTVDNHVPTVAGNQNSSVPRTSVSHVDQTLLVSRRTSVPNSECSGHQSMQATENTAEETKPVLALRLAQVQKLQAEITHKSGVRLILRKKDCINAVAFVDCFGSVWIAGWKQKEHPLLHSKFHIGDRILSIAGHEIRSVQDALKVIKVQHGVVEFVVRRIPYAKVLAIKRDYEGQDLGIVREGGTGEIKELVSGSLVVTCGLSSKAPSVDGTSFCNWFLTEINQRPLNLFFKDNEIHTRLNAVGLDISILVQPIDFVKAIKKQLKTIRGYKDYMVQ